MMPKLAKEQKHWLLSLLAFYKTTEVSNVCLVKLWIFGKGKRSVQLALAHSKSDTPFEQYHLHY